tara:strand:+ start:331 stop:519 length:189 start_codon:yes stop_codon:yes gene_type:complete
MFWFVFWFYAGLYIMNKIMEWRGFRKYDIVAANHTVYVTVFGLFATVHGILWILRLCGRHGV